MTSKGNGHTKLQSMGSQRVRHDSATKQQQQNSRTGHLLNSFKHFSSPQATPNGRDCRTESERRGGNTRPQCVSPQVQTKHNFLTSYCTWKPTNQERAERRFKSFNLLRFLENDNTGGNMRWKWVVIVITKEERTLWAILNKRLLLPTSQEQVKWKHWTYSGTEAWGSPLSEPVHKAFRVQLQVPGHSPSCRKRRVSSCSSSS